jgi:hypothetical protein
MWSWSRYQFGFGQPKKLGWMSWFLIPDWLYFTHGVII